MRSLSALTLRMPPRAEGLRVPRALLPIAAITTLGLALRLTWVLYVDTYPLGGDPHWYYVVGINISKGYGFVAPHDDLYAQIVGSGDPTAFWPPFYPFVLAALFKVVGVTNTAAQVLNAVLTTITIVLIYAIGQRIFSRTAGLVAAFAYAICPPAISGLALLFPESVFTFIFMSAIWLLVAFPLTPDRSWRIVVAFGFLLGVAALTRGQGLVLVPVALLYWWHSTGWRPAARATAIALLTATAVIAPWTVRNAVEFHAFIPISTNAGAVLREGHAPDSVGDTRWTHDEVDGFYMWESYWRPDWEVKGYRVYTQRAIDYALGNPRRELELSARKVYHVYRPETDAVHWLNTLGTTPIEPQALEDALPMVLNASYYTLLFAALLAAPLWLRRRPERMLLVNIVLFWTLFHIVYSGDPRYHVPLFPAFALSVGGGVAVLADWLRARRTTPPEANASLQ